jgi:two-component system, OmpR family, phosphate regulon response regulator PhoB
MSASILIVEDEAAIHQLLDYNLKSEGYRTRVVESGEEVHTAIGEEVPDLGCCRGSPALKCAG